MTVLYFDCFSGASGDMILGALVDAGQPLDDLRRALGALALDPGAVWTDEVTRAGVRATKLQVRDEPATTDRQHPHGHDAHGSHSTPHRTLREIARLIDESALSATARASAHAMFERLAEAEAAIHGTPVERVHLHEVGALDSIIDIVGTAHAIDRLRPDRIMASPLPVGRGSVRTAHGVYPVPAPATARLLQGVPIESGEQARELVTPTGALLLTTYADSFGPPPPMRIRRIGYGAGACDPADRPNVLRVLVGDAAVDAAAQRVVMIESEIDDMNPQIYGAVLDRLLAEGALDVFYTPIQMKKNRPGTLLSIVAPPDARERLVATVFRETTSIGVRYREMDRECLDREILAVETPFGTVRIKVARRHDVVTNASPEFEDCARVAAEHGRPIKDIQAAAMKAFLDRS